MGVMVQNKVTPFYRPRCLFDTQMLSKVKAGNFRFNSRK